MSDHANRNKPDDHQETARSHSRLHGFITFRLSRLQAKLNTQANAILARHCDLSLTQWRIISLIEALGTTTSTEISAEGELDKGLLSRGLKVLVAEGLVEQETDKGDHRRHLLKLSPTGRALHGRLLPVMKRRQAMLTEMLTEAEIGSLTDVIDKLEVQSEIRDV